MRKIILTVCAYESEHPMLNLFNTHIKPRIDDYCLKHDFEFIIIDKFEPYHRDWSWAKIIEAQKIMKTMDEGDIIVLMDADSVIMDSNMSLIFNKDIAIAHETTGCLCMGLVVFKVSDFSKKFIDAMCDEDRHETNKHTYSWQHWHENDALYHICGINWGEQPERVGTRNTTPFTINELKENVLFLPPEYNVTFNPEDTDKPNKSYLQIKNLSRPERIVKMDSIFIRHLAGGMIYEDFANKYFNYKRDKIKKDANNLLKENLIVYQFIFNDACYECPPLVISTHITKKGAEMAMMYHKQKEKKEHLESYGNEFEYDFDKWWGVRESIIKH